MVQWYLIYGSKNITHVCSTHMLNIVVTYHTAVTDLSLAVTDLSLAMTGLAATDLSHAVTDLAATYLSHLLRHREVSGDIKRLRYV